MTLDTLFWVVVFTALGAFAIAIGAGLKRQWFICGVSAMLSLIAALVVIGGGTAA